MDGCLNIQFINKNIPEKKILSLIGPEYVVKMDINEERVALNILHEDLKPIIKRDYSFLLDLLTKLRNLIEDDIYVSFIKEKYFAQPNKDFHKMKNNRLGDSDYYYSSLAKCMLQFLNRNDEYFNPIVVPLDAKYDELSEEVKKSVNGKLSFLYAKEKDNKRTIDELCTIAQKRTYKDVVNFDEDTMKDISATSWILLPSSKDYIRQFMHNRVSIPASQMKGYTKKPGGNTITDKQKKLILDIINKPHCRFKLLKKIDDITRLEAISLIHFLTKTKNFDLADSMVKSLIDTTY